MIRKIRSTDSAVILNVINDAAQVYKGAIPPDCWKEPYMTSKELEKELERGVEFYGWFEGDVLAAVMGIQPVKDVTLIRHAYVLTSHQRRGLGEKLLNHLVGLAKTQEIYVETWTAARWAVQFYQKNGFELIPKEGRSKLRRYWTVSDRHAESSVC